MYNPTVASLLPLIHRLDSDHWDADLAFAFHQPIHTFLIAIQGNGLVATALTALPVF